MKTVLHRLDKPADECSVPALAHFAEEHGLTLAVFERPALDRPPGSYFPIYARFDGGAEIKEGWRLVGAYGDGETEGEATLDYARQISGRLLVIHAMDRERRREIQVPEFGLPAEAGS